MIKSLGIIGLGQFGAFFLERTCKLAPWLQVSAWDENGNQPADLKTVLQSDVVVFAVRAKRYVEALEEYVPMMRADGIIVDVCTCKMKTVEALRRVADKRPYIATHPMFGPQAFIDNGNSLKGEQLAICESILDKGMSTLLRWFLTKTVELEIVMMTPEEHDEFQAREQLLVQYQGSVMRRTGFGLNSRNIHPRSAMYFYRAMKLVENDEQLFNDISQMNPFWPKVLAEYELAAARQKVDMLQDK